MGDILKRHLSIVIAATLTIVGTVVLLILVIGAWSDVNKKKKVLEGIKRDKESIFNFKWALNSTNRETAEKNLDVAVKRYQEKFDEIAERYKPPKPVEFLSNPQIESVERIRTDCEAMRERLDARNVSFDEGTGKFTFSKYLDSPELPPTSEIPEMMRHLQIVDEIVDLIGRSGVSKLTGLSRDVEKLEMEKKDGYRFYSYQLRVSGSFDATRKLVNSFNNSRYFFIVREMTLIPEDIVASMATGGGESKPTPRRNPGMEDDFMDGPGGRRRKTPPPARKAPVTGGAAQFKENRLAFNRMAQVELTISLDYVEVVEDAKSKRKRKKTPKKALGPVN